MPAGFYIRYCGKCYQWQRRDLNKRFRWQYWNKKKGYGSVGYDYRSTDEQMKDMVGLTITKVTGGTGDEEIVVETQEGRTFKFYHEQDCCESVWVEDVAGEWDDLIGHPLRVAEEVSDSDAGFTAPPEDPDGYDSNTWTFYRLGSERGFVVIRFHGTSNGYYSESAHFTEVK